MIITAFTIGGKELIMDNNETLSLESTTSEGSGAGVSEEKGSATVPQEQNTTETNGTEGGTSVDNGPEVAPFMTIRYNHEERHLTQEEAVTLAQKGVAYDDMYKTISRAAALKGTDVKTFIGLEKAQDDAYREELIAKYGEDDMETVNSLMELYNQKKESTIKAAEEAEAQKQREQQTTLESRLADEFITLQKEFPEIEKFDALPKSVINAAAKGQDLLSAYLLYQHSEHKKAEAAKKTAEAAKNASGGSLADTPVENNNSVMNAMMEVFSR